MYYVMLLLTEQLTGCLYKEAPKTGLYSPVLTKLEQACMIFGRFQTVCPILARLCPGQHTLTDACWVSMHHLGDGLTPGQMHAGCPCITLETGLH